MIGPWSSNPLRVRTSSTSWVRRYRATLTLVTCQPSSARGAWTPPHTTPHHTIAAPPLHTPCVCCSSSARGVSSFGRRLFREPTPATVCLRAVKSERSTTCPPASLSRLSAFHAHYLPTQPLSRSHSNSRHFATRPSDTHVLGQRIAASEARPVAQLRNLAQYSPVRSGPAQLIPAQPNTAQHLQQQQQQRLPTAAAAAKQNRTQDYEPDFTPN